MSTFSATMATHHTINSNNRELQFGFHLWPERIVHDQSHMTQTVCDTLPIQLVTLGEGGRKEKF